jgi:hypothetical protein
MHQRADLVVGGVILRHELAGLRADDFLLVRCQAGEVQMLQTIN